MKILVAGIGNVFRGDDGFGVEVAQALSQHSLPKNVDVIDFGIRSLDFAYALMDGAYDFVVIIDAIRRGHPPGTLALIDLNWPKGPDEPDALDSHEMVLPQVLQWIRHWQPAVQNRQPLLRVLGCEVLDLGTEEEGAMGLSAPVKSAVAHAIPMIQSLIQDLTPHA